MTPTPKPKCDACGAALDFHTRGDLKGLCYQCCRHLNGGKHSARIVKSEAAAIGWKPERLGA